MSAFMTPIPGLEKRGASYRARGTGRKPNSSPNHCGPATEVGQPGLWRSCPQGRGHQPLEPAAVERLEDARVRRVRAALIPVDDGRPAGQAAEQLDRRVPRNGLL